MFKNLEAFASGFLRIKFGIVEALKVLSESLRNPMSECLRNMVRILKKFHCESHYLTNQLELYGHQCRIIPGKAVQNYIDTYFSGQKNDLNDAQALAFLGQQKRLKFVRAKNKDEMQLQTLLTVREHYIDEYRKTLTSLKGLAQYWGLRLAKSLSSEIRLMALIEDANLPEDVEGIFKEMVKMLGGVRK